MLKQNKEMTEDCPICCEEYTAKTRAPIQCGHCDFTACKQCVRKFAINPDSYDEPHCMSCKGKWERSFFKTSVNSSWFNGNHGYKQHMKNGLFNLEKSRFPDTMEAVSNYVKIPQFRIDNKKMETELAVMQEKVYQLRRHIRINKQNIERFSMGLPAHSVDDKKKEKKVFIHRCPAEGCLGFLSSAWKCGICNVWACSNCGEIKGHTSDTVSKEQLDEAHVCKPENIESMKMIKKDTKPCPDCAVPIFKISGCDQMWCTQCHIAFSWNTGRKVTGIVHNPHFYAWARENNTAPRRVVGEVVCGGIPPRSVFMHTTHEFVNTICIVKPHLRTVTNRYLNDAKKLQLMKIVGYVKFKEKNNIDMDILRSTSSHCMYYYNYYEDTKDDTKKTQVQNQINNIWYLLFVDFLRNSDDYHRRLTHFRMVELDGLRRDNQNQTDNKMLRIQYLAKEITQKTFETKLLSIDKKRRKKTALLELFELINTVFTETFIDIINKLHKINDIIQLHLKKDNYDELMVGVMNNFKRIIKIICYANKQLRKISHDFNLSVPHICFNLRMYRGSWKGERKDRTFVEPNNNATIVETHKLKDWLAINQIQTFLTNKEIINHPVYYFERLLNLLYTLYSSTETSFNINTPIHLFDEKIKNIVLKAPIPIVVLTIIKDYLYKKSLKSSTHDITKVSMNIKKGILLDDNANNPYTYNNDEETERTKKAFKYYKKAYICYTKLNELINSKKFPYNRNVQCSNGKTIRWYEETTFPKIINE